jgi:acyl-coenzyme A synthetase/AMP-(fatty) acid ligase
MKYIQKFVRNFINQPKDCPVFESQDVGLITFGNLFSLINEICINEMKIDRSKVVQIDASPRVDNALQIFLSMLLGLKVSVDELTEIKINKDSSISFAIDDMFEYVSVKRSLQDSSKGKLHVLEEILIKNIEKFELDIKTSGSTGEPSHVILTGSGICHQAVTISEDIEQVRSDRQLMYMPFNYVYGLSVLMTSINAGSTLVESADSLERPKSFFEQIKNKSITIFSGVPFVYNLMVKRWGIGNLEDSSLRILTQAGGVLGNDVKIKILNSLPNINFWIMYGQTEFGGRISQFNLTKNQELISSAGKAINGVKFLKSDRSRSEYEIFMSSISAAKNIRELKESINIDGEEYFSTGDVGYIENNYIYIVGRNKSFVKVAGSRVNLVSIEQAYKSLSGIVECVVEYDDSRFPVLLIGLSTSGFRNCTSQSEVKKLFESNLSCESEVYKIIKSVPYYVYILENSLPKLPSNKLDMAKIKKILKNHYYEKKTIYIRL